MRRLSQLPLRIKQRVSFQDEINLLTHAPPPISKAKANKSDNGGGSELGDHTSDDERTDNQRWKNVAKA